jgi:hypothetical protein
MTESFPMLYAILHRCAAKAGGPVWRLPADTASVRSFWNRSPFKACLAARVYYLQTMPETLRQALSKAWQAISRLFNSH